MHHNKTYIATGDFETVGRSIFPDLLCFAPPPMFLRPQLHIKCCLIARYFIKSSTCGCRRQNLSPVSWAKQKKDPFLCLCPPLLYVPPFHLSVTEHLPLHSKSLYINMTWESGGTTFMLPLMRKTNRKDTTIFNDDFINLKMHAPWYCGKFIKSLIGRLFFNSNFSLNCIGLMFI